MTVWLRAALRLSGIVAWTGICLAAFLAVTALLLPWPSGRLRWRWALLRGWSRGLAALMGMRVKLQGTPPSPPFYLVANHLSYVDIILLYTCLDCVFVAKREMRSWPVIGFLSRVAGTIWVNRESPRDAVRVLGRIDAAIARGDGVVLFAEGTTSAGEQVMPLRPALLDWAAQREHPVYCAALGYRTRPGGPPAHLAVCWWGTMTLAPHALALFRLPGFEATVDFGAEPVASRNRGELAARVRQEIQRRFVPVLSPDRESP